MSATRPRRRSDPVRNPRTIFTAANAPQGVIQTKAADRIERNIASLKQRRKFQDRFPAKKAVQLISDVATIAVDRARRADAADDRILRPHELSYETKLTIDGEPGVPSVFVALGSEATRKEVVAVCTLLDPHLRKTLRADWYDKWYRLMAALITMPPEAREECLRSVDSMNWRSTR